MRAPLITALSLAVTAASSHALDPPTPDLAARGRYTGVAALRVALADVDQLAWMLDEGFRPLACRPGLRSEWIAAPADRARLRRAGIPFEVVAEDLQVLIDEERRQRAEARRTADGNWYADYRTWPEVVERLQLLAETHPELVTMSSVGETHEGRTIRAVRVSTSDTGTRPAVLFNGCQHAREWVAVMVPVSIAEMLAEGYGEDAAITALLDQVDVYVIPVVNPDGYAYTYASGGDRYWRKNRRDNPGGCDGVDLNRNWGVDWNGGESTSTNPCSDVYVGPGPFSEPEPAAMRDFILERPAIVAHIDFHSYGELILQPWAYTNESHPEFDAIDALGAEMSEAIESVHGVTYPHGSGDDLLYLASGVFPDWTTSQDAFGYTIELPPSGWGGGGFELPPSQILPTCEENRAAALAMMGWAATQAEPCSADVDDSGTVDVSDVLAVLAAWGDAGGAADVNQDGLVDVSDMLAVIAAWGPCD